MNKGPVAKYVKQNNIVMSQTDNFVPRTCEYYLHFNVNLPYPCNNNKNTEQQQKISLKKQFFI